MRAFNYVACSIRYSTECNVSSKSMFLVIHVCSKEQARKLINFIILNYCYSTFIRVKFHKIPDSATELIKNMMNDMPDILLLPTTASLYIKLSDRLSQFKIKFKHSGCVDFFEMATIAARTYPGALPKFTYFRCFSVEVWVLIAISIIVLSLISTQQTLKLIDFYEFLWNYSTILFTKSFQKFITHLKCKYFLEIWLISAFILSIEFTAYLLDFMALTQPVVKIDTLKQLGQRTSMKIVARSDSSLAKYAEVVDSDLARAISLRLQTYSDTFTEQQIENLSKGLRNGSIAFINVRLTLIFSIMSLPQYKSHPNEENLIEMLHISEDNGGLEPYFVLFNPKSDEWIPKAMNKM